jgi:pimeloyl-ACP methyl ester carboxylesterase
MTPLVLLPGMMCDARLFGQQLAALQAHRPYVFVSGQKHADMVGMATAILTVAPPRFALAGLSMGGIVAMEVLRQAPDRVERLALLDTNPRAELPGVSARREAQIDRALAGDLRGVLSNDLKPNYLAPGPNHQALLDLCMDMALCLGVQIFVNQSRALATRPDQRKTLARFTGPSLVLMGAQDQLCPRDRHDEMHALMPQSQLQIIENAGHLPTLENPKQTTAAIARWLEE